MASQSSTTGHVFISYAREDQVYARNLADSLNERGFETWMDDRIDFGDRWWQTIVQAIRASVAVVVVMTPHAEESEWVEREVMVALDEGKPIFPLLLRGRRFPLLVTTQYADVTGGRMPPDDFYERLEQIVLSKPEEDISRIDEVEQPEPEPLEPEEKKNWAAEARSWLRRLPPLAAWAAGLLMLAPLIGLVVWLSGVGGKAAPIPTSTLPILVAQPTPTYMSLEPTTTPTPETSIETPTPGPSNTRSAPATRPSAAEPTPTNTHTPAPTNTAAPAYTPSSTPTSTDRPTSTPTPTQTPTAALRSTEAATNTSTPTLGLPSSTPTALLVENSPETPAFTSIGVPAPSPLEYDGESFIWEWEGEDRVKEEHWYFDIKIYPNHTATQPDDVLPAKPEDTTYIEGKWRFKGETDIGCGSYWAVQIAKGTPDGYLGPLSEESDRMPFGRSCDPDDGGGGGSGGI